MVQRLRKIKQNKLFITQPWHEFFCFIAPQAIEPSKKFNMYGLLTRREVKMAGYWPSSFFACLWTEMKSRSINTQKKNKANISSHRDRTSLVNKGFIIRDKTPKHDKFSLRDKARIASGQDSSGSQSQREFRFILPAHGARHIIYNIKTGVHCY